MTTQKEAVDGLAAAMVDFPPASGSTAGAKHAPDNSPGIATIAANITASLGDPGNVTLTAPVIDSYTSGPPTTLSGSGSPGDSVFVTVNGAASVGPALVDENGAWEIVHSFAPATSLVPRAVNINSNVTVGAVFVV